MKRFACQPCRHFFAALLLLALVNGQHAGAGISTGPEPKNAAEEQQRRKLLFDQAVVSHQEKLKTGLERHELRQSQRAQMIQAMAAERQERQQAIALQPVTAPPGLRAQFSGWAKPLLAVGLLAVTAICLRHIKRKFAQETADYERNRIV